MRIGYIGNFRAPYSTENYVAKALERMGHEVLRWQEDDFKGMHEMVLDLVLWTRTWPGHITLEDLEWCKARGLPTASYHLDLYLGIGREESVGYDPFWHTDYVFTADGDPNSAKVFKKFGINHYWLPAGMDKLEAHKGVYTPELACDVAFVGTAWDYHQEWPYRHELVTFLHNLYGDRFRLFGQAPRREVRGELLNDVYASAKVVVGDCLCKNFTHENYWSDRLYETTGRGGFLIHPYVKGIETQFDTPNELVTYTFNDFNELSGKIDFYIGAPEIRAKISERALKRVKKDHLWENRLNIMLEVINAGHSKTSQS